MSDAFEIDGFKWKIEFYPNGNDTEGDSDIYLKCIAFPSENIKKVKIHWVVRCKPLMRNEIYNNSFYELNDSKGVHSAFPFFALKKHLSSSTEPLLIECEIVALQITDRKDEVSECELRPSLPMKENLKLKLNFEGKEEMDKVKKAKNGECFFSESKFSELFYLECVPNGQNEKSVGRVELFLELKYLPLKIEEMKVNYEMQCVETKTTWNKNGMIFGHKTSMGWGWPRNTLKTAEILNLQSLHFECSVTVLSLKRKGGKWEKFKENKTKGTKNKYLIFIEIKKKSSD